MEAQSTAKDILLVALGGTSDAHRSPESVSQLLKTLCTNKIRAVEALTVAMRCFSSFPKAALSFAGQASMEARHLAMLASRLYKLNGTLAPNRYGAELPDLLPGLKVGGKGGIEEIAEFVSQLYRDQHAKLFFSEETARLLEDDKVTQRIVSRIAMDDRQHLASIRILLDWLTCEGPENEVRASPPADGQYSLRVN